MAQKIIPEPRPSLGEAVRFWWKLGWISFGGTAAHLSVMHDELVERRCWIDSEHFFHALSHCMLLPGPEAQQLAIYIGWKLNGKKGGVLAGVLFVLPSIAILLILSLLYGKYGAMAGVVWAFKLVKPVVVALVLRALVRIGTRALRTSAQWAIAAVAFGAITFLHVPLPWAMAIALLFGIAKAIANWPRRGCSKESVHRSEVQPQISGWLEPLQVVASCLSLAAVPIVALGLLGHDVSFWSQLCGFFTRTAFVTLGGSYTVIPYVAQVAVVKYGWLTNSQMLDGFALAETTPGPLIIVVACRFHGRLSSLPRFIRAGHSGSSSDLLLYVPAVFSLRLSRCAMGVTFDRKSVFKGYASDDYSGCCRGDPSTHYLSGAWRPAPGRECGLAEHQLVGRRRDHRHFFASAPVICQTAKAIGIVRIRVVADDERRIMVSYIGMRAATARRSLCGEDAWTGRFIASPFQSD